MLPPSEPSGFDDWYAIYPRKQQRRDAAKIFARVIRDGTIPLALLIERTRAFAARWEARPKAERKFIPYPASWLNKGGYNDEPEGDGNVGGPTSVPIDPRSFDEAGWQRRLKYFHDKKEWLEVWGPEPGKPGCLVPPHLLVIPVSTAKGAAA
jgi:hypothetical protein